MASSSAPKVSIVSLLPGQIKVHSQGEFAIGLVCRTAIGPCAGVVTVRLSGRKGAAAAPTKVRLPGDRMTVLTLALTRPARKMLASGHHLNVAIAVQVRDRTRRGARLTVRRGLVPGAPLGCWPQMNPNRGGYPITTWARGRLFSYPPGNTYGCLYRLDHAYLLDDPREGSHNLAVAGPAVFADPFAASLVEAFTDPQGGLGGEPVWSFASWDLRTGQRVHLDLITVGAIDEYRPLVVSASDGAIAWIYADTVNADDAGGYRRLDTGTGTGIDHNSLRLSGNGVSWIHDGLTRTATLS